MRFVCLASDKEIIFPKKAACRGKNFLRRNAFYLRGACQMSPEEKTIARGAEAGSNLCVDSRTNVSHTYIGIFDVLRIPVLC